MFFFIFIRKAHPQEIEILTKEQKEIFKMELAQLTQMDVIVTSPSKRPQKIQNAASAIYVITQEDIRRMGAVNIMEALRFVPGVLVSKLNQNRYAISIRGFNRRIGSDKLLVLMDGRSIYSPAGAGVFWIGQDTVMDDIDRIEVIRGPGAALWGSNAVAGVINIITKSSKDTQGLLVSGGGGTEELGFVTMRYGDKAGEDISYRFYGKYKDRDGGKSVEGADALDNKQMGQLGFRGDWKISPNDHLTMQGDYYNLDAELDIKSRFISIEEGSAPFRGGNIYEGANFLTRWNRTLDDSSSFMLQAYYDRWERRSTLPFKNIIDQADIESQYDFLIGKRQKFSLGANYRFSKYDLDETELFKTRNTTTNLFGFFINDEITLIPKTWNLILGSKFEHNDFTGFEIQPNIRTIWMPHPNHSFWAAISRAVRIPSITEDRQIANRTLVPLGDSSDLLIREINNGILDAEELIAYEAGYKFQYSSKISFDITSFFFDYDKLIELTIGSIFSESDLLVGTTLNDNALEGEVYGVEFSVEWQPLKNWRLSGNYSFTEYDIHAINSSITIAQTTETEGDFEPDGDLDANGEPQHLFKFSSYLNLPYNLELDSIFYLISENSARNIRAYNRFDLRLGWRPSEKYEISLVGQNLLDSSHYELNELLEFESETERSGYIKATYRF